MSMKTLVRMSRLYGNDSNFVLANGGNTSYKTAKHLFIKPSGISLANIDEYDFVKLERVRIRRVFELKPPKNANQREALVKRVMQETVAFDSEGRPSVEAPLHEALDFKYVVHLHPALVNGMTCGRDGKSICGKLFPDALWVDYSDPGYSLAVKVKGEVEAYTKRESVQPAVIFLQNHGVFVGADSEKSVKSIYARIMETLSGFYHKKRVATELNSGTINLAGINEIAPALRTHLALEKQRVAVVTCEPFDVAEGPLTPDHVVYAKSYALTARSVTPAAIAKFVAKHGYKPPVVSIPGGAVFCAGGTLKDAITIAKLARDGALVRQLSAAFGGTHYISTKGREFIENWEVESYRKQIATGGGAQKRLRGKIALVTGGAQGFGFGIADGLAANGATVAIADLNLNGAMEAAAKLNAKHGAEQAFALSVDISDEASVESMINQLVCHCGGVDLFVANAGVLKAGSVKTLERDNWDFVTNVNYTGYFLCVKHAAKVMATQNAAGDVWSDIIQVNSKSGLVGSNRNGAYAGSKFGTIGLTQSFALELIDDKIKVNSVCPGNFFDGPLWSDPDNGLFVQYLRSGKVPGAKTLTDVKAFYEAKVPMNRGCDPDDVVKAILYAVEQQYETGQAIPVTGGQVMLS